MLNKYTCGYVVAVSYVFYMWITNCENAFRLFWNIISVSCGFHVISHKNALSWIHDLGYKVLPCYIWFFVITGPDSMCLQISLSGVCSWFCFVFHCIWTTVGRISPIMSSTHVEVSQLPLSRRILSPPVSSYFVLNYRTKCWKTLCWNFTYVNSG